MYVIAVCMTRILAGDSWCLCSLSLPPSLLPVPHPHQHLSPSSLSRASLTLKIPIVSAPIEAQY